MAIHCHSLLTICPINFIAFNKLNELVGNIEETLVLSKIKFHQQKTKLVKNGKACIARSRQDVKEWFGFGLRKTDLIIHSLIHKEFLIKTIGTFFGKKKLFLSASVGSSEVPINMVLFNLLIKASGSVKAALALSRILFGCAGSTIIHEGYGQWFCFPKEKLSLFLEISLIKVGSIFPQCYLFQKYQKTLLLRLAT